MLVGPQNLAQLFGDDVSWIHRLTKEGMPQASRGKYEVGTCLVWYIKYLKKKLKDRGYVADEELASMEREERLRLLRAEASLREIELALARGEFMAVADFEKLIVQMVVVTKARILSLPSRVASRLVAEGQSTIEDLLERELREALSSLKNGFEKHAPANTLAAKLISEGSNGRNGKSDTSNCESREVRVLPDLR